MENKFIVHQLKSAAISITQIEEQNNQLKGVVTDKKIGY